MPIVVGNGIEIGNGITITSGPGGGGSVVTDGLTVQLTPSSYPGNGSSWLSTTGTSNAVFQSGLMNTMTPTGLDVQYYSNPNSMESDTNINNFDNNNGGGFFDRYTIEVWFKGTDPGVILSKWGLNPPGTQTVNREPYYFRWDGNNVIIRTSNDGVYIPLQQFSVTAAAAVEEWVQVVGVFNWKTQKLTSYKNGSVASEITNLYMSAGQVGNASPVRIGADDNRPTNDIPGITGRIGIIRMYNKALTSAEVNQNFNADRSLFGI